MRGGEVLAVSGARPLSVVVGRSNVTEVQVRGKTLDLTQVSKNGVARFEVK
jgi:cytoskeleton protein RodZ